MLLCKHELVEYRGGERICMYIVGDKVRSSVIIKDGMLGIVMNDVRIEDYYKECNVYFPQFAYAARVKPEDLKEV